MVQGILPPHQGYLPPAVLSFLLILSTNFFFLLLIQAALATICWARRQDTLPGRFLIDFMEAAFTALFTGAALYALSSVLLISNKF